MAAAASLQETTGWKWP